MNIYIGNMPHSTTEQELTELFTEYGAVNSVKIITDQFSGKPRGFGFIDMENKSDAINAISELDGKDLNGRLIKVNEARPREKRNNYNQRSKRW